METDAQKAGPGILDRHLEELGAVSAVIATESASYGELARAQEYVEDRGTYPQEDGQDALITDALYEALEEAPLSVEDETVTRIVLGTGGPHTEFRVTHRGGEVRSVEFDYRWDGGFRRTLNEYEVDAILPALAQMAGREFS